MEFGARSLPNQRLESLVVLTSDAPSGQLPMLRPGCRLRPCD